MDRELRLALGEGQALSSRALKASLKSRGSQRPDVESQAGDEEEEGGGAKQKPSHRKCLICVFHDDEFDPVDLAFNRKKFMWWGKPPSKTTGETVGTYCGYCTKIFTARMRGISRV